LNTVAATALGPIPDDLTVLHLIAVADFHSDSSHPVFPRRADAVVPFPKL
jgi:hypothetical protein